MLLVALLLLPQSLVGAQQLLLQLSHQILLFLQLQLQLQALVLAVVELALHLLQVSVVLQRLLVVLLLQLSKPSSDGRLTHPMIPSE